MLEEVLVEVVAGATVAGAQTKVMVAVLKETSYPLVTEHIKHVSNAMLCRDDP